MLWTNEEAASNDALRRGGEALPATFDETFDAAWRDGLLFSSGISQSNARIAALDNYVDEVRRTSGQDISAAIGSDLQFPQLRMEAAQNAVSKLKQDRPGLQIPELTDDELDRRAASIAGLSHEAFAEMSGREKTLGGKLGMLAGGLLAGAGDPINLIAAPVAPAAQLGIVGTAALWGGFGAGSQAVNEIANAQFREMATPGYAASGAPVANIAEAAAGGAVLGGLFKGLGAVWSRMKTGEWPRSVRDAGNIVESEANVQGSNVLPGVEGEAVHREAIGKTIDDIVAGRPIEVPENVTRIADTQGRIMDARDAATSPALQLEEPSQTTGSLQEVAKTNGFNTEREFWHGTTLGKFTKFRESTLDNDVLGPASYLSTKAGAEFYGPGRGGDLLGPFWVRGEIANPDTPVLYALSGFMAGKMAPAINAIGRLKIELTDLRLREPWGKDLTPAQYAGEFWKRRGFAGYDSGAGLEVAVYDPENIRAGFSIEHEATPTIAVPPASAPGPDLGGPVAGPARLAVEPAAAAGQLTPAAMQQTLADPAHSTGLMADLERMRDTGGKPQMIPIGTDAAGEPQYQLLDAAIQEAKDYENAASQIESCINPLAGSN